MADVKQRAESLIPKFKLERLLNQDQAGRRTSLLGNIDSQPALLILERASFPTAEAYFTATPSTLSALKNLGANDIYHWFMARSNGDAVAAKASSSSSSSSSSSTSPSTNPSHTEAVPTAAAADNDDPFFFPDLKINLIYPCTETHIKKYSKQQLRFVTETPQIYTDHVRPYMRRKREEGRLNWVYNIIEGRKEVEDVIYRTPLGEAGDEGFLLLPDLNWDRKTIDALHLLALVERRDLWSLRDLKRKHIPWLRHMRTRLVEAATAKYPELERDQIKLYVHYLPTYFHLHVHIVHVQLEAGATQAVGKAVGLDSILETLECMEGGEEAGMDRVAMSYTLGEESDIWNEVFGPIKAGEKEA